MKLIVGLGNPGLRYSNTRHNVGFMVVKALAKKSGRGFKKETDTLALASTVEIGTNRLILALPLTYMNLCGNCVKALLKKHKIAVKDLLVVCDDIDLELGRIKIRAQGSAAGHNGLKSIIAALSTDEFARLRVGISRPQQRHEVADFVLSGFSSKEKPVLKDILARAVDCAQSWVLGPITETMNIFNKTRCENE